MRTFAPTILVLLAVSVCVVLCCGCIRDRSFSAGTGMGAAISFESAINGHSPAVGTSRAEETGWREDDVIGIYMVPAGGGGAPDSSGAGAGAAHRHVGGGDFAAEPGHELFWPRVGRVDFTAYHPWRGASDDLRDASNDRGYSIDVRDQSDPHAIDFMWSDNAAGHSPGDVPFLEFHHVLSKLVFRIVDSTHSGGVIGGVLEGLEVVVEGLPAHGVFDMAGGRLAVIGGSEAPIVPLRVAVTDEDAEEGAGTGGWIDTDPSRARFEAVVLPGEGLAPVALFRFADGETGWLPIDDDTFLAGKMYIFDVAVTEGGAVTMGGTAIVDWEDRPPGEYTLPKTDPGGPDDPGDDPFAPKLYFRETMGGGPGVGGAPVKIGAYTGWDNARGMTIGDRLGGADVRSLGSLGAHIWFPPGVNADLRMEGLPAGYTDITLSYDITVATTGGVSAALIRVYAGSTNMTSSVTRLIPSPNVYTRVTLPVPDGTTSLRWVSDGSVNTHGMRLDNIRLEGVKR